MADCTNDPYPVLRETCAYHGHGSADEEMHHARSAGEMVAGTSCHSSYASHAPDDAAAHHPPARQEKVNGKHGLWIQSEMSDATAAVAA